MGSVLQTCKSALAKSHSTPVTKREEDIDNNPNAQFVNRDFNQSFLKNSEDLIQEISAHSRWEHFEVRYILAQFRKLNTITDDIALTDEQLLEFIPAMVKSVFNNFGQFQESKYYNKWCKGILKLLDFTEKDGIHFQPFVRILDNACRGTAIEKATLLLNIFDIDNDGHWNTEELDLFLNQVLSIPSTDIIDERIRVLSETKEEFDEESECILDRDGLIEYLQQLLAPPVSKKKKKAIKDEVSDDVQINDDENDGRDENKSDINDDDGKVKDETPETNTNTNTNEIGEDDALLTIKINEDENISGDETTVEYITEDFLGDLTIAELKTVEYQVVVQIVVRLLRERLVKKNKIKGKVIIKFAASCINFQVLFSSFMIIPTREEECRIVKAFIDSSSMQLGSSWFVISQTWWEQWCLYSDYTVTMNTGLQTNDGIAKQHALRPLKISNGDLLDHNSHFRILRKGMQENNEFKLIPKSAWKQLQEWYAGGPAIERFVICTQKEIRMKVLHFSIDKMLYDYKEREILREEALKKRKKKTKKPKMEDSNDSALDSSPHSPTFNLDAYQKEYALFMAELDFDVIPDAKRIDLYPIFINYCKMPDKGNINSNALDNEYCITRYATLPELYVTLCAQVGHSIRDLAVIQNDYQLYLDRKRVDLELKSSKNKKNKRKSELPMIDLPPRLWLLEGGSIKPVRMLYPRPLKKTKTEVTAEENSNNSVSADGNTDDVQADDEQGGGDKDQVLKAEVVVVSDSVEHPSDELNADSVGDTVGDSVGDTNDVVSDDESDDDEDMDLQTLGLQSGYAYTVECPLKSKKNADLLFYRLNNEQENIDCEPEIDDSWLDFEIGDKIDARDRWGKWYHADIKNIKSANTKLSKKEKICDKIYDRAEVNELAGVFVSYDGWDSKWDEWIFIFKDCTICNCRKICQNGKRKGLEGTGHRLAARDTQHRYLQKLLSQQPGNGTGGGSRLNDYWVPRQRDSVRGAPSTAGCVGLANLGNTCFMNSIIQCVSNTPHLRTFFTSGQYKPDINKNNPLGMGGKLAHEFAKLMTDMWSGNYQVIAPRSLKRALASFAPQFSGWQQHDSQEFLAFLLDGLHEDLNLIVHKPYTDKIEANGRSDALVADLAWKIYLMRNKSKIVDLFQAQYKSKVVCPNAECGRVSVTFEPYMYLSVPIVGHLTTSLIVDVFHRKTTNDINKPTRHVFHCNKYEKVRFLAQIIGKLYDSKPQFIAFYENFNMKVSREFDSNRILGSLRCKEAIACYIYRDWNCEVTPKQIKKYNIYLCLAKMCHSQPLDEFIASSKNKNRNYYSSSSGNNQTLFGMPFILAFLSIHTRRRFHKLVYERLHNWVGGEILPAPPVLERVPKSGQKVPEKTPEKVPEENENTPENESVDDSKDAKSDDPEDDDIDNEEEDIEYEDITAEQMEAHELAWDETLSKAPYVIRLLPNRHYYSWNTKHKPAAIPIDDREFDRTIKSKETEVMIEWTAEAYEATKSIVNKVVMDAEYSKWKKENAVKKHKEDVLTLYDCINAYVHEETLNENDLWYCCKCKEHKQAGKKIDLYSFPEILTIHLKRFQILGRFGRGQKLNKFVDFPIRGLDLTPYVISEKIQSKPIYDLYAISCHSGGCGGGHYTAYALNAETDRWYSFNDSSVRPATPADIVTSAAYVLFYRKCH